MLQFKRQIIYF